MKYPILVGAVIIALVILFFAISPKNNIPVGAETAQEKKDREQGDMVIINKLKEAGTDPYKIHKIEHHFNVKDKKTVATLSNELKQLGYEVNDATLEEVAPGEKMLTFDAVGSNILDPDVIFKESEKMELLARKYGVQYDGWGCMVVK